MVFEVIDFLQKTNKFDFTTMIPQVDLFLFVFWRKYRQPQKTISKLPDLFYTINSTIQKVYSKFQKLGYHFIKYDELNKMVPKDTL